MSRVYLLPDGGKGGRDQTAMAFILRNEAGHELMRLAKALPDGTTVNEAEYLAITEGVYYARSYFDATHIFIFTDSQLVANQLTGQWQTNEVRLAKLKDSLLAMLEATTWKVRWMGRENNDATDQLVKGIHTVCGPSLKEFIGSL